MKTTAVPSRWTDWLLRLLAIRFRIRDAGVDTFPGLYRQGPDVILMASGYLTPRRYLRWLQITEFIKGCATLAAAGSVIVLLVPEWRFSHGDAAILVGASSLLVILAIICTGLNKTLGKLVLGKKTAIEFTAKKVTVYRNGYGLSWPITVRRSDSFEVSSDLTAHEGRAIEELKLRNSEDASNLAALVYADSWWVTLIHGSRVVRVAEVYEEFTAKRLAEGIKKAESIRHQLVAARIEQRDRIELLPE